MFQNSILSLLRSGNNLATSSTVLTTVIKILIFTDVQA